MRIGNVHAMSMSVNASMNSNNSSMNTALSRLSSGLRINSAADDASGMIIANSLTTQAHAITQEVQNRNDEIGMLQIADRAMSEQSQILETIKVKLVQRANDTQNTQSRRAIDQDIAKLLVSYDEIVKTTSYNGRKLLSGTFQMSSKGLNVQNTEVSSIGHVSIKEFETITKAGSTEFTLVSSGKSVTFKSVDIGYEKGTGIGELARTLNSRSSETGVQASYIVKSVSTTSVKAGTLNDLKINDVSVGNIVIKDNDKDNNLVSAINLKTSQTGVAASVDSEGKLVLISSDGRGIKLENAQDLKILSENYGKLSLTKSGASEVQVDAEGLYRGMTFTQKNATLNYIEKQNLVERSGEIDPGGYSELTSEMITNYTTGSGVYNTSDLMNIAAARSTYSLDGTGYTVAVIDTGLDSNHDFFDDRVLHVEDFTGEGGEVDDANGHGTHVSSIIGSSDSTYTGAAPGVNLVGLKSLKNVGGTPSSTTEAALQWVIANANTYNIAVINMSLGNGTNDNLAQDALSVYGDELKTLADMGIINVAAAGNDYAEYDPNEGSAYPGNSAYTIGVGAVFGSAYNVTWPGPDGNNDYNDNTGVGDDATAYNSAADVITPFSQRSTDVVDIFAVGAPVIAADTDNLSGVTTKTGTSQAAPQVAGIAVLVQEYAEQEFGRKLTFDEMKDLLVNTAVDIDDPINDTIDNVLNTGETYKRVDALGAIKALEAMKASLAPIVERGNSTYDHSENNIAEDTFTPLLMTITDHAIQQLTAVRSDIGSTQNMLISDVNYKSIQSVNLMNSASQIQDADFAVESAQLSKSLILVQASSYAFSQINQRYQMIERLLA